MEFRTEIVLPQYNFRIGHSNAILSVGSCFADLVGNNLKTYKFNTLANPFGTLFNPVSIFHLLSLTKFNPDHIVERDGIWYSLDVHSEIAEESKAALVEHLDEGRNRVKEFIQQTDYIVVTLGTAFVHVYNPTGEIVSNCQKVPKKHFTKKLLSSNFILKQFKELDQELQKIRPGLRYVFTVSPVRHLKETLELNQVSKATLRLACHKIIKETDHAVYFPAYEIMMDDLRDYRFYKEDLIHPSEMAEAYIWEKFSGAFFTEDTRDLNDRLDKIHRSLAHRPFQPNSSAYHGFLVELKYEIEEISKLIGMEREQEMLDQLFSLHLDK